MKAKTKFIKMFYKLPEEARAELILNAYSEKPATLSVVCLEVKNDTELGKHWLKQLGYEDD